MTIEEFIEEIERLGIPITCWIETRKWGKLSKEVLGE